MISEESKILYKNFIEMMDSKYGPTWKVDFDNDLLKTIIEYLFFSKGDYSNDSGKTSGRN